MSFVLYTIEAGVGDGVELSAEMSLAYERAYISVVFYSDAFITPVIPSAGTLTFQASETGEKFGTIPNGVVDVTEELYDRPNFSGSVKVVRATADSIADALNYRATISRFESGRS